MITIPTNASLDAYSYLYNIKQDSNFFTDSEIEGAQKVQKLQKHLYWPVTSDFKT